MSSACASPSTAASSRQRKRNNSSNMNPSTPLSTRKHSSSFGSAPQSSLSSPSPSPSSTKLSARAKAAPPPPLHSSSAATEECNGISTENGTTSAAADNVGDAEEKFNAATKTQSRGLRFWVKNSISSLPQMENNYRENDKEVGDDNSVDVCENDVGHVEIPKSYRLRRFLSADNASASTLGDVSSLSSSDVFSLATSATTDNDAAGAGKISFPPCRNIDEAMYALHTLLSEVGPSPHDRIKEEGDEYYEDEKKKSQEKEHTTYEEDEYDWLLDGDPPNPPGTAPSSPSQNERRKKKLFGDEKLDSSLSKLELEPSFSNNSLENNGEDRKMTMPSDYNLLGRKEMFRFSAFESWEDSWARSKHEIEEESNNENDNQTMSNSSTIESTKSKEVVNEQQLEIEANNEEDEEIWDDFVSAPAPASRADLADENDHAHDEFRDKESASSVIRANSPHIPSEETTPVVSENDEDRYDSDESSYYDTGDSSSSSNSQLISQSISFEKDPSDSLYNELLRFLPLADCSTQAGRFTRRIQLELQHEDSLSIIEEEHSLDVELKDDENASDIEWWQKSAKEMERELPEKYFTQNFDPVMDVLQSVPWTCCTPGEEYDDEILQVDEYLTRTLSQLDAAHKQITTDLVQKVQAKEEDIAEGLKTVQEIDVDIAKAHMYAMTGKKFLDRARLASCPADHIESDADGGIAGILAGLDVLRDADQRERFWELDKFLDTCSRLIATESMLTTQSPDGSTRAPHEFGSLISMAAQLRADVLQNKQLKRLECLASLRDRVSTVMHHLSDCVEDSLAGMLSDCLNQSINGAWWKFPSQEYGLLLQARLDINSHQMGNAGEEVDTPTQNEKSLGIESSWSRCILHVLCKEADICLIRALLEPTCMDDNESDAKDDIDGQFHEDLLSIRHQINQIQQRRTSSNDAAVIQSLTRTLFRIRFEFESHRNHLLFAYHKLCVTLAELLHLHYLITQWHKSPFDSRNEDDVHLHRCGCPEDESSVADDETTRLRCPLHIASLSSSTLNSMTDKDAVSRYDDVLSEGNKGATGRRMPLETTDVGCDNNSSSRLRATELELCKSRTALWKYCETIMIKFLENSLVVVSRRDTKKKSDVDAEKDWAIDLEGLQGVLRLTHMMMLLAEEFMDSEVLADEVGIYNFYEEGKNSGLKEALSNIFREHLHEVHVEAMTTMGAMLSSETWQLSPVDLGYQPANHSCIKLESYGCKNRSGIRQGLESILEGFSPLLATSSSFQKLSKRCCWEGQRHIQSAEEPLLSSFVTFGNPFLTVSKMLSRFLDTEPQTDHSNSAGGDCMPSTSSTASSSCDTGIDTEGYDEHCESSATVTSFTESNPCLTGECSSKKEIKECFGSECKAKDPTDGPVMEETESEPYATILSQMGADPDEQQFVPFATQSGINGLGKFTARLLTIAQKLPFIVSDVSRVLSNIYDLYFLTVFRLCTGNAANEKILLGLERCPSHSVDTEDDASFNRSRKDALKSHQQRESPLFPGFSPMKRLSTKKTNKPKRSSIPRDPISPTIEADICSPLPCEQEVVAVLREYILEGRERLGSMVNLDKIDTWDGPQGDNKGVSQNKTEALREAAKTLENRFASAHSCLFVALLLDAAYSCLAKTIGRENNFLRPGKELKQNTSIIEPAYSIKLDSFFEAYVNSVIKMSPTLVLLACRMAGVRAVSGKEIVLEVLMIGRGWDESKLNEHSNPYIDELCDRCAFLWGFMSSSKKLPTLALRTTWDFVIGGSFLSLLEGFSRVLACSTEGRALMSMDLETFSSGTSARSVMERVQGSIESVDTPPPAMPQRGKLYVDTYVKVYYYPEEDILKWIHSNHDSYRLNHSLALITCCVGCRLGWQSQKVSGMKRQVRSLYENILNPV